MSPAALLKQTISRDSSETGRDQPSLYALGLEHVRRLAQKVWTDHNTHDPGITTLELLCYALTDLTYRASAPIEDQLATPTGAAAAMQEHFFSARRILPMRPLTALDYRKLLIDLPGVRNAWIEPVDVTYYADTVAGELRAAASTRPGVRQVNVRGVYRAILCYDRDVETAAQKADVRRRAQQCLHGNRNLCEDFAEPAGIEDQAFLLCGEFELSAGADVSAVKAEALVRVERYLSPLIPRYTLSEMLARTRSDGQAYTAPDVFDGPVLAHGFIDDEELEAADLKTELRLSDIISELMDIDGVEAVRDIVIAPTGQAVAENRWVVAVDSGKHPTLDRTGSRLVFYKRGLPVTADAADVEAAIAELETADDEISTADDDVDIPVGRHRSLASYRTFQDDFPVTYGVGPNGIVGAATTEREALARQLKGYLLFFDQMLANYFAQLAQVRTLFSCDPVERTYHAQLVTSLADYAAIYGETVTEADIAGLLETSEERAARRERFLNHLIARFAERFHEFAGIMYSAFGSTAEDLEQARCAFLRNYPLIGAARGLGYDYTRQADADRWDSGNISGLERRVAALLEVLDSRRRNLGALRIDDDARVEIYGSAEDQYRFRLLSEPGGRVLLRSSRGYESTDAARAALRLALARAELPSGYERKTGADGRYFFSIVDDAGLVLARRDDYFDAEDARDAAMDDLLAHVRRHYSLEGMFVVENILLRAERPGDPFLPICVDPNCTDCADDDPYSYRIHVVLPAYAGRFQDMDFRRFVEEVIREETPAHVLPKVCWVSEEDMTRLEQAYRPWIDLRAGLPSADRAGTLRRLADALYAVRNVYPTQSLAGCDDASASPFVLGRTALGTDETTE